MVILMYGAFDAANATLSTGATLIIQYGAAEAYVQHFCNSFFKVKFLIYRESDSHDLKRLKPNRSEKGPL